MPALEVTATPHTLHVSARDVIANVMAEPTEVNYIPVGLDTHHGDKLIQAMSILDGNRQGAIIHPAGLDVTEAMAMIDDPEDLPSGVHLLEELTDPGTREGMARFGYMADWSLSLLFSSEREGNSYLDEDVHFTVMEVLRAFTVTPVTYRYDVLPGQRSYGMSATSAYVDHANAVTVPQGAYLWATYGTYGPRGTTAGYVSDVNFLPTFEGLYEVEGGPGSVSRMEAGCDTCGGRWFAESGSWRFRSEDPQGNPAEWEYDEAVFPGYGDDETTDAPDNVVRCPVSEDGEGFNPCPGFVHFMAV